MSDALAKFSRIGLSMCSLPFPFLVLSASRGGITYPRSSGFDRPLNEYLSRVECLPTGSRWPWSTIAVGVLVSVERQVDLPDDLFIGRGGFGHVAVRGVSSEITITCSSLKWQRVGWGRWLRERLGARGPVILVDAENLLDVVYRTSTFTLVGAQGRRSAKRARRQRAATPEQSPLRGDLLP